MPGMIAALITAMAWAGSSTLFKLLSNKFDAISLNTLSLWIGSIILISFTFLSGRGSALIDTPANAFLMVAASGLISMVIGDTVYLRSLSFIDVSRAFPIALCAFPVLSTFVVVLLLAEAFAWYNIIGAVAVVTGIYLITTAGRKKTASPKQDTTNRADVKGVMLALTAAVFWTLSTVLLTIGVVNTDPLTAAVIRVPVATIALTGVSIIRSKGEIFNLKKYGWKNMAVVAVTGVLTYGVASVSYVTALQLVGAGRTVLITAIAPIFVLLLSIFFLKEKPTIYTVTGALTSILGVSLISMR
ncbi:MAG TPA: DMT family transporter [Candidatus Limnocylindrales bacterium]|nr:DMT family transporter [Candidatus Limnocylindrales bacterium]